MSDPFDKLLTICKLNKIMCNSKICTLFNVCMKDKKYIRKINYLPYLSDKCLQQVTNVSSVLKK